jgi:hypothetical protein
MSLGESLPVPPLVLGSGQIDPTQQRRKLFVTQNDLAKSHTFCASSRRGLVRFHNGYWLFASSCEPLIMESGVDMLSIRLC